MRALFLQRGRVIQSDPVMFVDPFGRVYEAVEKVDGSFLLAADGVTAPPQPGLLVMTGMMGETSTGPVALANNVQQRQSFLEVAKHSVCREIPASQLLQLRRPKLIEGELGFIFTDVEVKRLVEDFRFALVLKFLSFRPNIDLVRAAVAKTWGLWEVLVVSHMDASNVLEKRNVTEIELGRDRNMDEDATVASKTSGIEIAKLRGDVTATHIMVRTKEDQCVKENAEELQEDSRDHDSADEAITISDKEVEGMVEELENIRDCILDFEQRANGHPRKIVHKGWYKLNTDGCCPGNLGICGAEGIILNEKGDIVIAFAENLGKGTNNGAELLALLYGL
ncbi:unnamed protein product [Fraxinus pennsylvanica]|uniref:RNase H type-1 domain-containing protein n=1 Tax=Fraxinus pennsylvanica TaxID=56036 RepID=A0AAD2E7A1_9LAMI|nr:unnamed protein product [Fraxinus pennsylvanica]